MVLQGAPKKKKEISDSGSIWFTIQIRARTRVSKSGSRWYAVHWAAVTAVLSLLYSLGGSTIHWTDRVSIVLIVYFVEFVPHIEKLFDESVLIGSGWTTYESLRYVTHS